MAVETQDKIVAFFDDAIVKAEERLARLKKTREAASRPRPLAAVPNAGPATGQPVAANLDVPANSSSEPSASEPYVPPDRDALVMDHLEFAKRVARGFVRTRRFPASPDDMVELEAHAQYVLVAGAEQYVLEKKSLPFRPWICQRIRWRLEDYVMDTFCPQNKPVSTRYNGQKVQSLDACNNADGAWSADAFSQMDVHEEQRQHASEVWETLREHVGEDDRTLLRLRYEQGLQYAEIGVLTAQPAKVVRSRHNKVMRHFRSLVTGSGLVKNGLQHKLLKQFRKMQKPKAENTEMLPYIPMATLVQVQPASENLEKTPEFNGSTTPAGVSHCEEPKPENCRVLSSLLHCAAPHDDRGHCQDHGPG